MVGLIISIVLLTLIPIVFIIFLRKTRRDCERLAPEEIGQWPVYQEKAGGRFNAINWTIPFVRVAVYEGFAVVAYPRNTIVFKKGEIRGVEHINRMISQGLKIYHNRKDIPDLIIIWTKDITALKQAFERCLL